MADKILSNLAKINAPSLANSTLNYLKDNLADGEETTRVLSSGAMRVRGNYLPRFLILTNQRIIDVDEVMIVGFDYAKYVTSYPLSGITGVRTERKLTRGIVLTIETTGGRLELDGVHKELAEKFVTELNAIIKSR